MASSETFDFACFPNNSGTQTVVLPPLPMAIVLVYGRSRKVMKFAMLVDIMLVEYWIIVSLKYATGINTGIRFIESR